MGAASLALCLAWSSRTTGKSQCLHHVPSHGVPQILSPKSMVSILWGLLFQPRQYVPCTRLQQWPQVMAFLSQTAYIRPFRTLSFRSIPSLHSPLLLLSDDLSCTVQGHSLSILKMDYEPCLVKLLPDASSCHTT
jgi:hypothetical protein